MTYLRIVLCTILHLLSFRHAEGHVNIFQGFCYQDLISIVAGHEFVCCQYHMTIFVIFYISYYIEVKMQLND